MAEETNSASGSVYKCWQYARRLEGAGSLGRHLLKQHHLVTLISNAANVGLHDVTAGQCCLRSLEDPEDMANFRPVIDGSGQGLTRA